MNKGFTLVELIAVVSILALLAIITTPAYDNISNNIKERNYKSKQETIKSQTLTYVEKYLKDETYKGVNASGNPVSQTLCFSVEYLIQNGIISSDDEEDEYIENDITGKQFRNEENYIAIYYDIDKLKLVAETPDMDDNYSEKFNKCNSDTTY